MFFFPVWKCYLTKTINKLTSASIYLFRIGNRPDLVHFFSGDNMTVYGGFGVSGPISDQIFSKSRPMGPVLWKQCSSEILSLKLLKFHEMICFGSRSTLKVLKFGFAQDLGGIIQFCFGYRLGS